MNGISTFFKKIIYNINKFFAGLVRPLDMERSFPPRNELSSPHLRLIGKFSARDQLFNVIFGPISFELLRTGFKLKLFDLLHTNPGLTNEEIANHYHLNPYNTEVLLLGLTSVKILKKFDGRFYNDPYIEDLLLNDTNSGFVPKFIERLHGEIGYAARNLYETILENKPRGLNVLFGDDFTGGLFEEMSKHPEMFNVFNQYMIAHTKINRDLVAAEPLFDQYKNLLDVGGGSGDLAMAFAKYHPNLHATVYDIPPTTALTQKKFDAQPDKARLHTHGGDVLKDQFPRGYDFMMFSHFTAIGSKNENIEFFRKAFNALEPNGAIGVFGLATYDDDTGPIFSGLFSSYFMCLAYGKGRIYSAKNYSDWMKEVGFKDVEIKYLPSNEVLVTGKKP